MARQQHEPRAACVIRSRSDDAHVAHGDAKARTGELTPPSRVTARESAAVSTLRELIKASDAVGVFEIVGVEAREGGSPDLGPITTYRISLKTVRLLAGVLPQADNVTVVTDDSYWDETLDGTKRDWLEPGYQVLLALHERTDTGEFRPIGSQGILAVDGSVVRSVWSGPLTDALDGMDRVRVESDIKSAG